MKKILILAVLCVSIIGFATTNKAAADSSSWQKSVSILPSNPNDFGSATFDQSVSNAIADGANYITLVIPVTQANIYSTQVYNNQFTPTDASLTSAVNYIHSKGASVAFVLHDDPSDGNWRARINPSDRTDWFASYGAMLNHYAVLGQSLDVQELVIGAELSDMTLPSVDPTNTANWVTLIQQVRSEYSGLVTYGAQHGGYMSDLGLGFWPELDSIGIDAYYGLGSGDESVATIESNWNQYVGQIQSLSTTYNKPVVFTEIGYTSQTNSLVDPGSTSGGSVDDGLQANAYQALFQYWQNYSFMHGVMLWDWNSNPNAGGTNNVDYTPQGKPAEQIMKQFFTSNSTTPPPPVNVTYTATSSSSTASPTTNNPVTFNSSVTSSSAMSNMLIDIEVYNAQGQQVYQNYYQGQNLGTNPLTYTNSFTPTAAGKYTVEMGVFTANWQSNVYWNSTAGTITVANPVTTPPPPPPTPTTVDVWWPTNGTAVSGVQPFQATLDGVDPSTYNMYWQVDGGVLNSMSTNMSPVAHKLAYVDLSNWSWSSNGQYTITFVAEAPNGSVIATQSVVITVN
jgi:hypothetical protein